MELPGESALLCGLHTELHIKYGPPFLKWGVLASKSLLHSQPLCGPTHSQATFSEKTLANSDVESASSITHEPQASDRVKIKVFDDMSANIQRRMESQYLPDRGFGMVL